MLTYRAIEIGDAPALVDLIRRSEAADGVPRVLEHDEFVEELTSEAVDLENSRLALDGDRIVGWQTILFRPSEVIEQRCHLEGGVDPEHRGRGIGRELVRFGIERSRELMAPLGDQLPKQIRIQNYEYIESAQRLAQRMGFTPVRWFEELLRPLDDLPPVPDVPGLRIAPWPQGRDEEIREVKNTAFLDHWGSTPSPPEAWHEQLYGFGGRVDLSFVALDAETDAVVACLVTARYEADDALLGRSDGWIQTLATLREWRGRGVGSALIIAALHAYVAAGLTHASIGVDSANPSGANRLYRALGFDLVQRVVTSQITL